MKKLVILLGAPLALAACGDGTSGYSEAWHQQKAACVGGDYAACADIGHDARAAMTPRPEKIVISQPIVD